MLYQRSFDIEHRLQAVLRLIRSGRSSTAKIAEKVGVSIPTISRDITALRERGYQITSQKNGDSWRFVLTGEPAKAILSERTVLTEARH